MGVYNNIERGFGWSSRMFNYLGTAILACMMLIIVADVAGRFLLNMPIKGSIELIEYAMVVVGSLGLAWCTLSGTHLTVGIIVDQFSSRTQAVFDIITHILSMLIFSLIAWQTILEAKDSLFIYQDISTVLEIPTYPFYFLLSFAFLLLCIAIVCRLIFFFQMVVKK